MLSHFRQREAGPFPRQGAQTCIRSGPPAPTTMRGRRPRKALLRAGVTDWRGPGVARLRHYPPPYGGSLRARAFATAAAARSAAWRAPRKRLPRPGSGGSSRGEPAPPSWEVPRSAKPRVAREPGPRWRRPSALRPVSSRRAAGPRRTPRTQGPAKHAARAARGGGRPWEGGGGRRRVRD